MEDKAAENGGARRVGVLKIEGTKTDADASKIKTRTKTKGERIMTIPSGTGAGGEDFAFDADQATAAGNTISALADGIRELPGMAQAQSGAPNLGSDRVSKAIADVIAAQNEFITAGAAHLSERLQRAAGNFESSAAVVRETEFTSAKSLTALPTTEA